MKSVNKILLLILILSNFSCSFNKEKKAVFEVTADYGNIKEGEVTYLLNDCIPFFNSVEYGFDLVLGMKISITYTGELLKQETYPSKMETSNIKIIDVKYENPKVYNYYYGQVPGSGYKCEIYTFDSENRFNGYYGDIEYVILENNTYTAIDNLKMNVPIYLITSNVEGEEKAKGFYTYKPI